MLIKLLLVSSLVQFISVSLRSISVTPASSPKQGKWMKSGFSGKRGETRCPLFNGVHELWHWRLRSNPIKCRNTRTKGLFAVRVEGCCKGESLCSPEWLRVKSVCTAVVLKAVSQLPCAAILLCFPLQTRVLPCQARLAVSPYCGCPFLCLKLFVVWMNWTTYGMNFGNAVHIFVNPSVYYEDTGQINTRRFI